jgi:hypothetical protein
LTIWLDEGTLAVDKIVLSMNGKKIEITPNEVIRSNTKTIYQIPITFYFNLFTGRENNTHNL